MKERRVGVLALQGDFEAHESMLGRLGVPAVQVRQPEQLAGLDGLIIPGGESTTLIKLIRAFDMEKPLRDFVAAGHGLFGTCAGSILMAKDIENSPQFRFGFMDIGVRRNGYGRQVDSFEKDLAISNLGPDPFHAVFIRAPRILTCGRDVMPMAEWDGSVVAAREGRMMVATFHPELTEDTRLHRYFIEEVLS